MNFARVIFRPLYWLAGKVFGLWARPEIRPEAPAELIAGSDAAVIYVLESGGLADLLALERACQRHGMPSPNESFEFCGKRYSHRFVVLRPLAGLFFRRRSPEGSQRLRQLVDKATRNRKELLLVPVAIYWGRSPDKENSFFKLLFSENWDVVGRTRKFFATLLLGRDTLLHFSHPLPICAIVEGGVQPSLAFRKVSRILRVHFRQRRAATVGPDLSNRRTIARQVLLSDSVRRVIDAEAGDDPQQRARLEKKAQDHVFEIASDVSHGTIRILLRILRRLWNQIYDGIELQHAERLHDVAKDKVIVYVPCHRSHFDYLLLSYICYTQGLQLPHIAAGINLNLPVIGRILRRGGAFFLRRTGSMRPSSTHTSGNCWRAATRSSISSRAAGAGLAACSRRRVACWQ